MVGQSVLDQESRDDVLTGLIRHAHMDESADAFVPILIYVVLKTNPDNLISNLEYCSSLA